MAKPQREDGHVDIANEIVEALAKTYLSSYESQVLWAIFRKTYGWHKKMDWITGSQLVRMTAISKSHISETLKRLVHRNLIIKNGNKLGFQKDFEKWRKLPKQGTSKEFLIQDKKFPKRGTAVPQIRNKKFPKRGNTKETKRNYTKETITKEKGLVFIKAWKDFKAMRTKIRKPMTERAEELLLNKLNKLSGNEKGQIAILNQSIMNSWLGVFPLKGDYNGKSKQNNQRPRKPGKDKYKHLEETYEV